jgi:ABC-2 type transport system permease protein
MPGMTTTYYDSAESRRPLLTELGNFVAYRGLVRLLVTRDLTVRYKRSVLGIWWTVLRPLLTSAVMWLIFGQIFRFPMEDPRIPYIVYLLSGVLFSTMFAQGVAAAGSAIVNSSAILTKLYVPAEVFALSSATAAVVNFFLSLIPLFIVQLVTGVGIPWTAILVPIPGLALLALITGIGLLVASAAVYFHDVLDLTDVFVQLITYAIPTFYPLSIVPERFRIVIYANPLYSYLEIFRGFVYEGRFADTCHFVMMFGSAAVSLVLGVWVFSRVWKKLVVML